MSANLLTRVLVNVTYPDSWDSISLCTGVTAISALESAIPFSSRALRKLIWQAACVLLRARYENLRAGFAVDFALEVPLEPALGG
ncbi:hypothetical protein KC323_g315 [Hortaea werneckii]|nr:hypothetical protein KC323_g315 [Hortaea werneckii]